MDLSNSVILPREDFLELQAVSFKLPPTPFKQRAATTVQTAMFCMIVAGAVTAGAWGWAKAMDWRDERNFSRQMQLNAQEFNKNS